MRVRKCPEVAKGPGTLPARFAPGPGEVVRTREDEERDDDLALLRALVGRLSEDVGNAEDAAAQDFDAFGSPDDFESFARLGQEVSDAEEKRVAFADMLDGLERGRWRALTEKQRAWALATAERLDVDWGDPGKRNAKVPRGKEVTLAVDAMRRALDPPGRKKAGTT